MRHVLLGFTLLLAAGPWAAADSPQDPALKWEPAIAAFEAQDQANPPTPGGILFLGSSSIRMWDLDTSFPGMAALNRGFCGSETSDSIYYFDRLVTPYAPSAIVFYAGDNDIARGKTAEQVTADFQSVWYASRNLA